MSAGEEKLKISWDDIKTVEVDETLRRQEAIDRSQANYAGTNPYANSAATAALPSGGGLLDVVYSPWFYMTGFGLVGGFLGWFAGEIVNFVLELVAPSEASSVLALLGYIYLSTAIFSGVVGAIIAFFLSVADSAMSRNLRGVIVNGCVGVAIAGVVAALGSCFANFIFQVIGAFAEDSLPMQILARAIGWMIMGVVLTLAPGVTMRSFKRLGIGLVGGAIGGFVGGLFFDPISMVVPFDIVSRFVGILAIGTLAGAATGLIEVAAKSGWVRVTQGLIVGKQFIFYKKATSIGSTPECDIYLFKDPSIAPRHATIHAVAGGYDLEDQGSATGTFVNEKQVRRTRLKNGDAVRIGGTVLTYQERAKS
ncbi:MAG TPA: FHA domain-containing protein [Pirellulaceae bacterium]|jgi:hypothetical protein|nr:FHA domain-containing protein [Pirellulaceae bacterium]